MTEQLKLQQDAGVQDYATALLRVLHSMLAIVFVGASHWISLSEIKQETSSLPDRYPRVARRKLPGKDTWTADDAVKAEPIRISLLNAQNLSSDTDADGARWVCEITLNVQGCLPQYAAAGSRAGSSPSWRRAYLFSCDASSVDNSAEIHVAIRQNSGNSPSYTVSVPLASILSCRFQDTCFPLVSTAGERKDVNQPSVRIACQCFSSTCESPGKRRLSLSEQYGALLESPAKLVKDETFDPERRELRTGKDYPVCV
mmetsp:Transcript_133136/g.198071  ORF Transcript_133136/g.198071 Transcript_133136/m.198071 type:complete len:257 (-) Transcript_133136:128-898(-)|eukprot:CAMPEP_0117009002 /NCGR_PEP_ID=MMETSP0472-20121206/8306_1 /TAXON_ID=693140 ORGANISM="Tiarina fusus, Strain LIS" /NCGR_SAMPLE_ID=MMETSP0472 /ASSEMBLY_ACC=CAM_ASM_000603 /LENGTH=256 /DNA_ID=CAMNT_0004711183 /DNA_START=139 /DNA_END=909 /DNA_ORIENTATION=-